MAFIRFADRPTFRNPWAELDRMERSLFDNSSIANLGESLGEVTNTKDKYAVAVDVSHFAPEEIKVR